MKILNHKTCCFGRFQLVIQSNTYVFSLIPHSNLLKNI